MRTLPSLLLAVATLCLSAEASAFCVYNTLTDRQVSANIVTAQRAQPQPPKLYRDTIAPGKESCCNPKNAECNPDRLPDSLPDAARLSIEARILPDARVPADKSTVACGKPTLDARFASGVESQLPLRGSLRFERNPLFDGRRPAGKGNPAFVLKAFTADNRLVATYSCPP